jgi:hypothetical protein
MLMFIAVMLMNVRMNVGVAIPVHYYPLTVQVQYYPLTVQVYPLSVLPPNRHNRTNE